MAVMHRDKEKDNEYRFRRFLSSYLLDILMRSPNLDQGNPLMS